MIVVFLRPVKRAEFAINIADIGVIDVAVHDIGDHFAPASVIGILFGQIAAMIRQRAKFLQRQAV